MNKERKYTYTIDWFVQKYINIDNDNEKNKLEKDVWNMNYVICKHIK